MWFSFMSSIMHVALLIQHYNACGSLLWALCCMWFSFMSFIMHVVLFYMLYNACGSFYELYNTCSSFDELYNACDSFNELYNAWLHVVLLMNSIFHVVLLIKLYNAFFGWEQCFILKSLVLFDPLFRYRCKRRFILNKGCPPQFRGTLL